MSRRSIRSLLFAILAGLLVSAGAAGFAGAASIEQTLAGGLEASAAPTLLGPITESGRTGWACKPERAASAKVAKAADLPSADTH